MLSCSLSSASTNSDFLEALRLSRQVCREVLLPIVDAQIKALDAAELKAVTDLTLMPVTIERQLSLLAAVRVALTLTAIKGADVEDGDDDRGCQQTAALFIANVRLGALAWQ